MENNKKLKIGAVQTVGSHSASIQDKNLSPMGFGMTPLFLFNSVYARNCPLIDKNYVISDYPEIKDKAWGDVYEFIPEDTSKYIDNMHHHLCIQQAIDYMTEKDGEYDLIVVLLGNVFGLNMIEALTEALQHMTNNFDKYDGGMSVSYYNQFNPWRAHKIEGDMAEALFQHDDINTETMYKTKGDYGWFFDGGFLILKPEVARAFKGRHQIPFLGDRIYAYKTKENGYTMEVDDKWQLAWLQAVVCVAQQNLIDQQTSQTKQLTEGN